MVKRKTIPARKKGGSDNAASASGLGLSTPGSAGRGGQHRGAARRTTTPEAAGNPQAPSTRKPFRYRPGTVALKEIKRYQKSFNLLIPSLPFARNVRKLTAYYSPVVNRWTAEALVALQEVSHKFVNVILARDLKLARRVRGGGLDRPW